MYLMDSDNHLNARRPEVIIEANIPFIRGILEPVADVSYLEPERFTPETVATADAIVTRTRVKCCEDLLGESRVSFIASATIGLDHVDLPWCRSHGITVVNAPGCNARPWHSTYLPLYFRFLTSARLMGRRSAWSAWAT